MDKASSMKSLCLLCVWLLVVPYSHTPTYLKCLFSVITFGMAVMTESNATLRVPARADTDWSLG